MGTLWCPTGAPENLLSNMANRVFILTYERNECPIFSMFRL